MGGIDIIEVWAFTREQAADIVGISDGTLANWLNRYRLFPEKHQGRGSAIHFILSDVMTLAAMKHVVDCGMRPESAGRFFGNFGGPYGYLFHPSGQDTAFPGTMVLAFDSEGNLCGSDGADIVAAFEIRAWPLFDKIFPNIEACILQNPGRRPLAEVEAALAAYKQTVAKYRKAFWGR